MEHDTGLLDDVASQCLGSTTVSTKAPFWNLDSTLATVIVKRRPVTTLPSMSVTIASTSIGSPSRTNWRVLRMPTYSVDGCTSRSRVEGKLWGVASGAGGVGGGTPGRA